MRKYDIQNQMASLEKNNTSDVIIFEYIDCSKGRQEYLD